MSAASPQAAPSGAEHGAAATGPALLFLPPQPPQDERERLLDLKAFGILDTAPDDDYERLVQLASMLCETPMAALSFIDSDRQWFKARVGVPVAETPRMQAICAHTILDSTRVLEIPDVARLPWLDPGTLEPGGPPLRFYAGVPLKTREGSAIGALCVMDYKPRQLTNAQLDALAKLARTAASQLTMRRRLQASAEMDRLTGLPNWFHFEAQFAASRPACGIITFVRLLTVNQINSAHGFRVADALIRQSADRLRMMTGGAALAGRIRRDLFVLFFPDVGPAEFARNIAPALSASLMAPYVINHLSLVCPAALGSASYPDDGNSLDEAVNAADAALQMGVERDESVAYFDKSVDNRLSLHYRLEPQLRQALRRDEFINYYQPKVDLATGAISGVEALVRWVHPERGLVPPMDFVPALETTGLIREVGGHVIRRALEDWDAWRAAGLAAPRVAVNVAAGQLRHADFVTELRRALEVVGGDASALGIEITESVLIGNIDVAIGMLTQVRQLGIPVAIDDFGTGYSSLAYIVTLPIDEIKIDRAFIKMVTSNAAYRGIINTCISLAHNLNLKVVAEGVETEGQEQALRSLQCDIVQGYYYSPPVPAKGIEALLRAGSTPRAT